MGWCHEFGPMINEDCGHPMVAGPTACSCPECGVQCSGKFDGCADVWARGPVEVVIEPPSRGRAPTPQPRLGRKRGRGTDAGPDEPPAAAPVVTPIPAPVPATMSDSGEIVDWLRAAFDGLWGELQTLNQSITEHDAVLDKLAGDGEHGLQSLQHIAQSLTERVEDVVTATLGSGNGHKPGVNVDLAVASIRGTLASVERSAAELISALEENFSGEFADVADEIRDAVKEASAEADRLQAG